MSLHKIEGQAATASTQFIVNLFPKLGIELVHDTFIDLDAPGIYVSPFTLDLAVRIEGKTRELLYRDPDALVLSEVVHEVAHLVYGIRSVRSELPGAPQDEMGFAFMEAAIILLVAEQEKLSRIEFLQFTQEYLQDNEFQITDDKCLCSFQDRPHAYWNYVLSDRAMLQETRAYAKMVHFSNQLKRIPCETTRAFIERCVLQVGPAQTAAPYFPSVDRSKGIQ